MIAREFGISKDNVISAGTAYAFELRWDLRSKKGRRPYLNPNSRQELIFKIDARISNNDCPSLEELISISHRLHIQQMIKAHNIGVKFKITKIFNETQPPYPEPDESTLRKLIHKLGYKICINTDINLNRFQAATLSNINYYFINVFSSRFRDGFRDEAIFNMDESSFHWDMNQ